MTHPAKFSPTIIEAIRGVLDERSFQGTILDPFAGEGGIHQLDQPGRGTVGIELEPDWAVQHDQTLQGDCLRMMADFYGRGIRFDAIITSPAYGNRLADRDMRLSTAGTYMKSLGREASSASSCHMQWGFDYRDFHAGAWELATRLLPQGGLFILNIKDHYRDKKRQHVAGWHISYLESMGFRMEDVIIVPTPSMKYGANPERCQELVVVMEKQ